MQVLLRCDHHCVPPVVDCALTTFGETLVKALVPLCEWGTVNRERVSATRAAPAKE